MEKTYKDGYVEGVKDALKMIKDSERNPKEQTRLSLGLEKRLQGLIKCK